MKAANISLLSLHAEIQPVCLISAQTLRVLMLYFDNTPQQRLS